MEQGNPNAERDAEIAKLIRVTNLIIEELGAEEGGKIKKLIGEGKINLDDSNAVSGILMTVFTALRKEANDPVGFEKYKKYNATLKGKTINIGTVITKIKAAGIAINFTVAIPIAELMTLFKASFDEVRTGVTKFKVRSTVAQQAKKRDQRGKAKTPSTTKVENTQNISQYGLNNNHIPLLQGITLAPERRTGVIRSLGPLTQAILLVMEDRWFDKVSNALRNSISMLPMANEIINCLKESNTPGRVAGIMKELGDILLLTTARSTQKMYFPLFIVIYMYEKMGGHKWSFSGTGPMKRYTELVASKSIVVTIKTKGTPNMIGEVIFHAIFGTYLEDLKVLEKITTKDTSWSTRKELSDCFEARASANTVEAALIGFKYVSKMAQSLLTKSLGNVEPCSTSRPSFAGKRVRTMTQEFKSYLTTGKSSLNYSSDPVQLQYALKKLKDQLIEDMEKVNFLKAGTTEWEEETMDGWVEVAELEITKGNKKFYGPK